MPLVGGARQPLAFIGAGLLSYGAGSAWLAATGGEVLHVFFAPQALALVHLWLPGFLLSVCFGAAYQLMPVVLGVELASKY